MNTPFQYSLCRIVYCCARVRSGVRVRIGVSIFALSNRVLLLCHSMYSWGDMACFNIRSVESCTAACDEQDRFLNHASFNIRSVESCTAAERNEKHHADKFCFNIRSVESCTAAAARGADGFGGAGFQYSLCRIVYCCSIPNHLLVTGCKVSIFALSNRVLLPIFGLRCRTRRRPFQYSLCRIVYCCWLQLLRGWCFYVVSIFALSNRVLLLASLFQTWILAQVSIFALSNRVLLRFLDEAG